jgi:hypothetical protein
MTGRSSVRRAAGWVPALVLAPASVAVAVALSVPEDEPARAREVFPLDPGTTWVYDVLDHGTPSGTRTSQAPGPARPRPGSASTDRT